MYVIAIVFFLNQNAQDMQALNSMVMCDWLIQCKFFFFCQNNIFSYTCTPIFIFQTELIIIWSHTCMFKMNVSVWVDSTSCKGSFFRLISRIFFILLCFARPYQLLNSHLYVIANYYVGIFNIMKMELARIIKIVPISHNPALNFRPYCSIAPMFCLILPV